MWSHSKLPLGAGTLIQDSPKAQNLLDGQHIPYHEPTSASSLLHSEEMQLIQGLMRLRQQAIVKTVQGSWTHPPAELHLNCSMNTSTKRIQCEGIFYLILGLLIIPELYLNCSRKDYQCSEHGKKQKARKPFLCCQNNLDLRNIL